MQMTGQTLVFDDFLEWLAHPTLDKAMIRSIFNEIEAANIVAHGYGSKVFLRSLGECFAQLQERPATESERREIDALAVALAEHRVELVPGVAATLGDLGSSDDFRNCSITSDLAPAQPLPAHQGCC